MEKSQVVVFGPDAGDRFADEFRLMGTLMDVVSEYKYLGLILHESLGRRTGPGSGLAYGAEKEKYLYKRLLDNDEERVIVDIFEDDSVSRRQLVAKTRLLVDNKPAPGEEHVRFYHVSETLDEVISAYRAANPPLLLFSTLRLAILESKPLLARYIVQNLTSSYIILSLNMALAKVSS